MKRLSRILMVLGILAPVILWAGDTAPRGLRAVAGDCSVYLRWSPPQKEVEGYRIYRALPDGDYRRLNGHSLKRSFYEDRNVVNGQFYWYRVTAIDSEGTEGDPSEEVGIRPNPNPRPLIGGGNE